LTGPITGYPWAEGIVLVTIIALFFLELMIMRCGTHRDDCTSGDHGNSHGDSASGPGAQAQHRTTEHRLCDQIPGEDHLGHARDHTDNADVTPDWEESGPIPESYAAQLTAIFILDFGIIFHSIFIGLTLAVSGNEFRTLYVVLVFHQTFEGLGLGVRLATVPWPRSRRWTPYLLAIAYGVSTPIAIAAGLVLRESYQPGSQKNLIINGIFDSISAGILIYTGLIELMAHEFMFSPYMQEASIRVVMSAFGLLCLGADKFLVYIDLSTWLTIEKA
jgi:zinc transporter 1/2/3